MGGVRALAQEIQSEPPPRPFIVARLNEWEPGCDANDIGVKELAPLPCLGDQSVFVRDFVVAAGFPIHVSQIAAVMKGSNSAFDKLFPIDADDGETIDAKDGNQSLLWIQDAQIAHVCPDPSHCRRPMNITLQQRASDLSVDARWWN